LDNEASWNGGMYAGPVLLLKHGTTYILKFPPTKNLRPILTIGEIQEAAMRLKSISLGKYDGKGFREYVGSSVGEIF
jgi:hypothetical protein